MLGDVVGEVLGGLFGGVVEGFLDSVFPTRSKAAAALFVLTVLLVLAALVTFLLGIPRWPLLLAGVAGVLGLVLVVHGLLSRRRGLPPDESLDDGKR
jgi:fatty acid desaturase